VVHTTDVTMVCPVGDAERVKALLAEVEKVHGARWS
jgi:mannose-1-phosphate guanylyltransferase